MVNVQYVRIYIVNIADIMIAALLLSFAFLWCWFRCRGVIAYVVFFCCSRGRWQGRVLCGRNMSTTVTSSVEFGHAPLP